MFAEDIINYLVANHTLFPLYTSNSDTDDIFPSNSAFTGGLYSRQWQRIEAQALTTLEIVVMIKTWQRIK